MLNLSKKTGNKYQYSPSGRGVGVGWYTNIIYFQFFYITE